MTRCDCCNKRLGILVFKCKFCEHVFCIGHNLPEVHGCDIKSSAYYETYKTQTNNNVCKTVYTEGRGGGVGA